MPIPLIALGGGGSLIALFAWLLTEDKDKMFFKCGPHIVRKISWGIKAIYVSEGFSVQETPGSDGGLEFKITKEGEKDLHVEIIYFKHDEHGDGVFIEADSECKERVSELAEKIISKGENLKRRIFSRDQLSSLAQKPSSLAQKITDAIKADYESVGFRVQEMRETDDDSIKELWIAKEGKRDLLCVKIKYGKHGEFIIEADSECSERVFELAEEVISEEPVEKFFRCPDSEISEIRGDLRDLYESDGYFVRETIKSNGGFELEISDKTEDFCVEATPASGGVTITVKRKFAEKVFGLIEKVIEDF